jgi:hypothetical protein
VFERTAAATHAHTHSSRMRATAAARPPLTGTDSHVLFRALNEQIRRMADSFGVAEDLELVCECEQGACFARLTVSRDEYEGVRRFPMRFLTRPGHVGAAERIVKETPGYAVVEKAGGIDQEGR